MNPQTKALALALLRHALTTAGGALVASGKLSPEDLQTGMGAVLTLGGLAWSWWEKRQRARLAHPRPGEQVTPVS